MSRFGRPRALGAAVISIEDSIVDTHVRLEERLDARKAPDRAYQGGQRRDKRRQRLLEQGKQGQRREDAIRVQAAAIILRSRQQAVRRKRENGRQDWGQVSCGKHGSVSKRHVSHGGLSVSGCLSVSDCLSVSPLPPIRFGSGMPAKKQRKTKEARSCKLHQTTR